jgi:hypothetical protein
MTGELAFAFGDRSSRRLHGGSVVRLCVLQRRQGLLDPTGGECFGQPGVEWIEDCVLAHVHGERVIDVVSYRVLVGEAASVMGSSVVPVALHASATGSADHESSQRVVVLGT